MSVGVSPTRASSNDPPYALLVRWGYGSVRLHEFDRALPTPVPWSRPVLTAALAYLWWLARLWRHRPTLYPRTTFSTDPRMAVQLSEKPREQAHLPAEQPSSGQDPRLPPSYAHARRPRHPCCSPAQGSLRTVRLRLGACCQDVIVCAAAPTSPQSFGGHAEQVDLVRAAVSWWCMPTRPTRARVNRRGSVLSSPRLSATRWSGTARNGC